MFSDFYSNINLLNFTETPSPNPTATKPEEPIKKRRPKQPKNPQVAPYLHHFYNDSYFNEKPRKNSKKNPKIKQVDEKQNKTGNITFISDNIFSIGKNKHQKQNRPKDQTQTNHIMTEKVDSSNNISKDSNENFLNHNQPQTDLNTSCPSYTQINHIYPTFVFSCPRPGYFENYDDDFLNHNPNHSNYSYNYYHLSTGLMNTPDTLNDPVKSNDLNDEKTADTGFNNGNDNGITCNFDDELESLIHSKHSLFFNNDND